MFQAFLILLLPIQLIPAVDTKISSFFLSNEYVLQYFLFLKYFMTACIKFHTYFNFGQYLEKLKLCVWS